MNRKELREKIEQAEETGELDLSHNKLSELPPEIVQLTSLMEICLARIASNNF